MDSKNTNVKVKKFSSKKKKEMSDELESIYHLEYMNDMVQQMNKCKHKIISHIYKEFISKDPKNNLDLKSFKNSILRKNREAFLISKSKSKNK